MFHFHLWTESPISLSSKACKWHHQHLSFFHSLRLLVREIIYLVPLDTNLNFDAFLALYNTIFIKKRTLPFVFSSSIVGEKAFVQSLTTFSLKYFHDVLVLVTQNIPYSWDLHSSVCWEGGLRRQKWTKNKYIAGSKQELWRKIKDVRREWQRPI